MEAMAETLLKFLLHSFGKCVYLFGKEWQV